MIKKCDVIIYSKDRASQLDLLLRSIKINFKNVNKVWVLYDFAGEFMEGYNILKQKDYGLNIEYIIQTRDTFYKIINNVINNVGTEYILPLCDDDVFIRDTDISDISNYFDDNIVGICFRRSLDLTNSYHTGQFVNLPEFDLNCPYPKWEWKKYDMIRWGYPYQAGGMVYKTSFFKHMINVSNFDLPNYLESSMNEKRNEWGKDYIICYKKSPIVNVSINRVQNNVLNRGGRDINYSPKELNDLFVSGKIINHSELQDMNNNCEFVEIRLSFI